MNPSYLPADPICRHTKIRSTQQNRSGEHDYCLPDRNPIVTPRISGSSEVDVIADATFAGSLDEAQERGTFCHARSTLIRMIMPACGSVLASRRKPRRLQVITVNAWLAAYWRAA
jgi:hypothetical protein